jgi:hypothetical protein
VTRGYSPLRRWLRQERAEAERTRGYGELFRISNTQPPGAIVWALDGPDDMREPQADVHKHGRDCSGSVTACGYACQRALELSE